MTSKYDTSSLVQIREDRHSTGLYDKRGLTILRGEGAYLWDERGVRYIDCLSGEGTTNLGHGLPVISEAIAEQAQRLTASLEFFYNDKRAELLEKLSDLTPDLTTRFLLCSSEVEARQLSFNFAQMATGRAEVIFGQSSPAPEALIAPPRFRWSSDGAPSGKSNHISFNDTDQMLKAVTEKTAALCLELMPSTAGVQLATDEFVQAAIRSCRDQGALLIIDESKTGLGRTGRMWALDHFNFQPDIMAIAGSLANGLPLGAVAITKEVGDKLATTPQLSIFGGNPIACAAACAALDYLLEQNLIDRAAELGDYLLAALSQLNSPLIKSVTGRGLLVGMELTVECEPYIQALAAQGILVLAAGAKTIQYLPPLVIARDALEMVVEKTALVLAQST